MFSHILCIYNVVSLNFFHFFWFCNFHNIYIPCNFTSFFSYHFSYSLATAFWHFPWRWVVERTFSWLNNSRRLPKDYEFSVSSSESMVIISHLHTLLKRLWIRILRFSRKTYCWSKSLNMIDNFVILFLCCNSIYSTHF